MAIQMHRLILTFISCSDMAFCNIVFSVSSFLQVHFDFYLLAIKLFTNSNPKNGSKGNLLN